MSLILRNKFLPDLHDEFLSNDFFQNFFDTSSQNSMPAVNIHEDNEGFKIELAAPGLEKKDFKIEIKNNVLSIYCEKESENEETDKKYVRKEFNYSAFKRSFSLPLSANTDKILASHDNGILTVSIYKKDEAREKPMREIEIR